MARRARLSGAGAAPAWSAPLRRPLSGLRDLVLAVSIGVITAATAFAGDDAARRADALIADGRFVDALPHAEEALAESEARLGPMHAEVAGAANRLANLRERAGDYAGAEALYRRALVITNRAFGWESAEAAAVQSNLATLYRRMGRHDQAETLYRQALEVAVKALGVGHREVATILNNLAILYRLDGAYGDAERAYLKAAEIMARISPPDHPDIAVALNNLGSFYFDTGRFEQAERFHRRSRAKATSRCGPGQRAVRSPCSAR